MKRIMYALVICLLSASQMVAQNLKVDYNPQQHTLSLQAQKAPVSKLVAALAKQDFNLYLIQNEKDFPVSGNFTNAPVDKVLEQIMPKDLHYFYRVENPAADKAIVNGNAKANSRNSRNAAKSPLQGKSSKLDQADARKPRLASAESLVQKAKDAKPPRGESKLNRTKPGRERTITDGKNSGGGSAMADSKQIKPAAKSKVRKEDNRPEVGPSKRDRQSQHLVVTFRVTKDGLEPVSSTTGDGSYTPRETADGNYAIVGSEGENVVFMETFEDPLEYSPIHHPDHPHVVFQAEEAFVTVKVPEKYASSANSQKLKLQFARLNTDQANKVAKDIKGRKLRTSSASRAMTIIGTAKRTDLSKLKKSVRSNTEK